MQLLGLAGSIRTGSHNRALLRAVGERLPAGATLDDLRAPGRAADLRSRHQAEPEPVAAWKAALAAPMAW
jgi:NAD(P)H-dependent FMN reductase